MASSTTITNITDSTDLSDGFSSEHIIQIVKEIRSSAMMKRTHHSDGDRIMYFRDKYPVFFEKFPKLFMAALDASFDVRFLGMMLKQRDTIIQDGTAEKLEKVSQDVYEGLNEKYLYPVLPKEQLEALRDKVEREKAEQDENADA